MRRARRLQPSYEALEAANASRFARLARLGVVEIPDGFEPVQSGPGVEKSGTDSRGGGGISVGGGRKVLGDGVIIRQNTTRT